MMGDEREATNGHDCDLNCSMGAKNEATDNDKSWLLLGGSSVGVNLRQRTSDEGLRIYRRKKRRKMCNSDEMATSKFNDKTKADDGSASDQDVARLSFDAFPIAPGEYSVRHCRKIVLQQMYQSLCGSEEGLRECIRNALMTYPESGCTSAMRESLDSVERCDIQTDNSAKEHSNVRSGRLLDEPESSTVSKLCGRAFFDILMSERFSELCGLLVRNFGIVSVNQILDVNTIDLRMKSGAYETSPVLYLKDIQQVWTKLQQVGNEMVTFAKSLSDKSRTDYEQFVRKPRATEACGASNCQGCGEKADVRKCLVCDSCEEIYHVACTELGGTEIPPKSWYCTSCVSNGMGSPHDNCIVCEKLKATASISLVDGVPITDEFEDVPSGFEASVHGGTGGNRGSKTCFICKSEVKTGEHFRTCGHSLCAHKFYHYKCLTSRQLGVNGPCWYCPSCLCRGCLVDKDDDKIVLCDGCDQAYHIYCTSPPLNSIPKGSWFCAKCDREVKRIRTVKRVYENMQNKVKTEDGLEKNEHEAEAVGHGHGGRDKSGGLDMLVTAAKTLSHQETMDTLRNMR